MRTFFLILLAAHLSAASQTDAGIGNSDLPNVTYCELTPEKQQQLISSGFQEIKSRFYRKGFSIFIHMRRKAYGFRFDTSFNDAFTMEYSTKIPFIKEIHQTIEGETPILVFNNKWITVNGIHYSSAITVSRSEKSSRVGMAFIKAFDWIIDQRNKKVYVKKNSVGLETQNSYTKSYAAAILDDCLVVVSRNSKFKKYNIGDVISTINGIEISSENIQELATFLLKTDDWNTISIEIKDKTVLANKP